MRNSFALEIGAATHTVHVEANVPLIGAVSSEQIDSFEAIRVRELPFLGAHQNLTTCAPIELPTPGTESAPTNH